MGRPPTDPKIRLMEKVRIDSDGCWIWQAQTNHNGYGCFRPAGGRAAVPTSSHRASYEIFIGPIPEGYEVDHLCRVILCCNPLHLEAVPGQENRRRQGASVVVCINGHDYTPENTYVTPRGLRNCKACRTEAKRRYRQRLKVGSVA